jgi:hypothetical protein
LKRLLIYLFLVVSIAVYAQKQAEDADASKGKPVTEQPEASGEDSAAESPDEPAPAVEGGEDDLNEQPAELPGETGADQSDSETVEPVDDSEPSVEDFEPDEEISEDYPVPLPSDI